MESYNSIPKWGEDYFGKYVFAFDKIDGSNFRAEWNRKLSKKSRFTHGFGKFGTRQDRIKFIKDPYCEGIEIFKNKFSEKLDKIFLENKAFRNIDNITVFGEFYGSKSFAGMHDWGEKHDVKIFDVFLDRKGILPPSDFIKIFEGLDTCKLVFAGIFSQSYLELIEKNILNLQEGVVCKGVENQEVFMFKIKTLKWLQKVRDLYGNERTDY
jgi:hypothetical protein